MRVSEEDPDAGVESEAADTPEDAAVRASRGLSGPGVTGVPQADINRIGRGAGNPAESTMQRLAHALNGRLQLVTA